VFIFSNKPVAYNLLPHSICDPIATLDQSLQSVQAYQAVKAIPGSLQFAAGATQQQFVYTYLDLLITFKLTIAFIITFGR
jgi:hypothetical protein